MSMKIFSTLIFLTFFLLVKTNSEPLSESDINNFFEIIRQPKKTLEDVHYSLASVFKLSKKPSDIGITAESCVQANNENTTDTKEIYHSIAISVGLSCEKVDFDRFNEVLKTSIKNLPSKITGNELDKIYYITRSLFLIRRKVKIPVPANLLKEKIFDSLMAIFNSNTGKFCASENCFIDTGKVFTILQNLNTLFLRQDAFSNDLLTQFVKISSKTDTVVSEYFKQKNVGLSTLSYFSSGLNQFSSTVPLSNKISKMYITLLRDLLLTREIIKSVKTIVDVYDLTEGLNSILKNNIHSSFFISPFKIDPVKHQVKVTVQNVYGKPVDEVKEVQLQKVVSVSNEDESLIEELKFKQSGVEYSLDYTDDAENIGSGFIKFVFEIVPKKKTTAFPSLTFSEVLKFVSDVEVKDFTVSLHNLNSAYSSLGKKSFKLSNTEEKLSRPLNIDSSKGLGLSFNLKNSKNAFVFPHQVFLQLTHKSGKEFTFVVKPKKNSYKFMIKFGKVRETLFRNLQGDYQMNLIIADDAVTNKIFWNFGNLFVSFGVEEEGEKSLKKPEIFHVFREAEKRPPKSISMLFFGLVVGVPVAILVVGLISLKPNFGGCPSGVGFLLNVVLHLNIALAIVLIGLYWVEFTIFEAFKYFLLLGVVYFTLGSLALRKVYETRLNK